VDLPVTGERTHSLALRACRLALGWVFGLTQDIDIVVDNEAARQQLELLIESLRSSSFLFTESAVQNATREKRRFQLFDNDEALKLDIYPRELVPGELSRSETIELTEHAVVGRNLVNRSTKNHARHFAHRFAGRRLFETRGPFRPTPTRHSSNRRRTSRRLFQHIACRSTSIASLPG